MSTGASTPGTAKADALLAEAQSATADEEKTYDMDGNEIAPEEEEPV